MGAIRTFALSKRDGKTVALDQLDLQVEQGEAYGYLGPNGAKHENLKLLGSIATAEEHDELEQATDDDVQDGHKQRRPPANGARHATAASSALALHLIEYLHPRVEVWPAGEDGRAEIR